MLKIQASLRESTRAVVGTLGVPVAHPEVDRSTASHKRLQIKVPTADSLTGTVVTAGRRKKGAGYDGFNVRTNRHVAVAASGGKAESTLSLQADGVVHLQSSQDSLVTLSAGPTVVTSSSAVNVLGGGGVVISAGAFATELYAPAYSEQEPPVLEPFSKFDGYADALSSAWKSIDDALKETVKARDQLEMSTIPASATIFGPTHASMTIAQNASTSTKDNNALGTAAEKTGGPVVIHGKGGLLIDTPAAGTVHAAKALVLSSEAPVVAGSKTAHVHAAETASLTAGEHVNVISGTDVHVVANDDKVHIAARKGKPVELMAKTVHVGAIIPGPYPQQPTESVYGRATAHVSLMTQNDPAGSDTTPGVFLWSHEQVKASGAKLVTLEVPSKDLSVVVDSEGKVELKAGDATVTLDKSGGITLKHSQATCELKTDKVTVKSGGNQVEVSAGGVKVAGASIKLG